MADRPLRAVLIGLGMVADTHARALAELAGEVEFVGVLSRRRDKAAAFVEGLPAGLSPAVFGSVQEAAASGADFAILATPPSARRGIVGALAGAGIHILTEKPVERSYSAAREIVALCETAGVRLGVVFQHRAREASRRLAAMLAEGRLGAIRRVEITVPWWREQAYYDAPGRGTYAQDGGGVLITQAIHAIDLGLSLAGRVRAVTAMLRTSGFHDMEAEDYAALGLEFASGAVGAVVASTASYPGGAERIELGCERATARLEAGQLEIFWRDGETERFGEASGSGGGADPMAFTHAWHQAVIADFTAAIREGRAPLAPGEEALAAQALIDAAAASSRQGRRVELREITDA